MNPIAFAMRRPFTTLVLFVALVVGAGLGLSQIGVIHLPPVDMAKVSAFGEKLKSYFHMHHEEHHAEAHKIVATTPERKNVTLTEQYVCLMHSQRHIQVRALERGYLEAIKLKEGQTVKAGDAMFNVIPILYQAKLDAETAENNLAQLEYNYTKKLFEDKVVSKNEVALNMAKVKKTEAKVMQARAELNFATVKAPFDGIVDRLRHQQGSLVEEGEVLTTLSDNSVMWIYFNVPEARYLEYMARLNKHADLQIELVLADGTKFPQTGKIGAIEADFNNLTGTVPFRADFPNPDRLLRHLQTGNVLISRVLNDALVIPQRAVFEVLDKQYVYVIDKDHVAHQREIDVEHEMEDLFVIKKGAVDVKDEIVLEGVRQVRDGDKVEFENRKSEQVLAQLKNHAE